MTQAEADTARMVHFGGVSPVPHRPATKGFRALREVGGPIPAAAAFPNFSYHGGPVVSCAKMYASFWGDVWLSDPDHLGRAARLSQFLKDLGASKYMNVLSQYGAGSGAGSGLFIQASFVHGISGTITDSDIHATIQSCINAGALPEPGDPSNTCVIVYLAEGIGVDNAAEGIVMCEPTSDTAFGYHNFFSTSAGHKCYYAVIPALDDGCLTESCPTDAGCSLHLSETQEQRQTQVTSHEFAEMVTDPELNAWFDTNSGAENGDICNGQADTITVGPNTWTVQRQYSKTDDINTNGATFCRTEADDPIPALTPGPSGLAVATARQVLRPGSLDRILPLPTVRMDLKEHRMAVDDDAVREFADRMLAPLQPADVGPQLSGLLHRVAELLQK
jgi:hypothetical protein